MNKIRALMDDVKSFMDRKDVNEELKKETDHLLKKMNESLNDNPNTIEDELLILQNWRVKFQVIKNKLSANQ